MTGIPVNTSSGIGILSSDTPYQLLVQISNHSTTSIKFVRMELIEQVSWKAHHGSEEVMKSILIKSVVATTPPNRRQSIQHDSALLDHSSEQ
jgi:hypothetical protein